MVEYDALMNRVTMWNVAACATRSMVKDGNNSPGLNAVRNQSPDASASSAL